MTRKHFGRSPTQTAESCSYYPDSFAHLISADGSHLWFRARNKAIAVLTSQAAARVSASYRVEYINLLNGKHLSTCATGSARKVAEAPKWDGRNVFYKDSRPRPVAGHTSAGRHLPFIVIFARSTGRSLAVFAGRHLAARRGTHRLGFG